MCESTPSDNASERSQGYVRLSGMPKKRQMVNINQHGSAAAKKPKPKCATGYHQDVANVAAFWNGFSNSHTGSGLL